VHHVREAADYRALLAGIFGGRRWIVAVDALAGATPLVASLRELGAEACLCVATTEGAGGRPDPDFAPDPIVVPVEAPDMMTGIRRSLDRLADLPEDARRRVDEFDPSHEARVLGTIFDDGRPVAGRAKYGARAREWQLLEDKTLVDQLWDDAGVERAPSRIVPAELGALGEATRELDTGAGCAWAGDSKEGFNGGATYVRWIRTAADAATAAEFFAAHSDRVRVMPFLEGIPCSIHGFVFAERTIALRPCEMVVFRKLGTNQLHYGRAATFWDPPPADREAMRDIARRVGDHLRTRVGYRGALTVDGVMTATGFLPTELNPRFGAALAVMTAGLDIPLLLLNAAVIEDEPVDWAPAELEKMILEEVDAHRQGGGMAMTRQKQTASRSAKLAWEGSCFRVLEGDGVADATAMIGPAATGGFVKVDLVPARTPVGPSAAPRIGAALAALDEHWQLGIGPLEAARDVRS